MEAKVIVTTELQLKAFIADAVSAAFRYYNPNPTLTPDSSPNGDFVWLKTVFPGVPENTLRQWDAAGKIPGSSRFGKRRIYHKQTVLDWARNRTNRPIDATQIGQQAEEQLNQRLSKKGGVCQ
ncbi:hypothetical protein GCM10028805_36720 [Spirosoma harenae]